MLHLRIICLVTLVLSACGGGEDPPPEPTCGNGTLDPGEACDGTNVNGATCLSAVNQGGTLSCTDECTLDTTACTLPACGNSVVEDGETCDGADLAGKSCSSIGYAGGTLGCKTGCALDVVGCCTDGCPTEGLSECVGNTLRVCSTAATGCLQWQVMDCGADNDICETSKTAASCVCVDRCADGERRCEGATIETCGMVGGCLDWMQTADCGADSGVCAVAPTGPICAADVSAENCADPYPLVPGENAVAWTAAQADYLTSASCETAMTGPDLVLSYTPVEDGFLRLEMGKPSGRQVMVVSAQACGTVAPEVACVADTAATLATELAVDGGTPYFVYVRDTTSGTAALNNPLFVTLEETRCSALTPTVTSLEPANGASVPDQTPILIAQFEYPVDPGAGVITVVGDRGTNLTFDLLTAPAEVAFLDGDKTLVVDPGRVLPANENITVSWTGLNDVTCGLPIAAPTWQFQVTGPACQPGVDGMIAGTMTRIPTGLSSLTEQYVAADGDPNGYVYVGGTTVLHRMRKAGGALENVTTLATLSSTNLGYDMAIAGGHIYTVDDSTSAADRVYQITTDGGATWNKQSYVAFPTAPNDDLRGITEYEGRLYLTTQTATAGEGTEIWSVAAGAPTLPQSATLEATILDEDNCSGIAVDDDYYYLACSNDSRLLRVHRVTHAVDVLSNGALDLSTTKNAVHAHDLDGDGKADVLYVASDNEEVHYVCAPNEGSAPFFTNPLASFGSGTSNYGLGFDRANNTLWMFDDDTREFVKIE